LPSTSSSDVIGWAALAGITALRQPVLVLSTSAGLSSRPLSRSAVIRLESDRWELIADGISHLQNWLDDAPDLSAGLDCGLDAGILVAERQRPVRKAYVEASNAEEQRQKPGK
jgi:hypothetical protein